MLKSRHTRNICLDSEDIGGGGGGGDFKGRGGFRGGVVAVKADMEDLELVVVEANVEDSEEVAEEADMEEVTEEADVEAWAEESVVGVVDTEEVNYKY